MNPVLAESLFPGFAQGGWNRRDPYDQDLAELQTIFPHSCTKFARRTRQAQREVAEVTEQLPNLAANNGTWAKKAIAHHDSKRAAEDVFS